MNLTLSEITSLNDPLYDRWLDLYQVAFPLNEQMLVSGFNALLRTRDREDNREKPLLACLDEPGNFKGMAHYEHVPEHRAAILWYFAVTADERGKGLGSAVYRILLKRIQEEQPALRAVLFEVEEPDACASAISEHDANRRIIFYKRNGAEELSGIRYEQSVGWQPPLRMRLMIHRLAPLDAEETFALAQRLFGSGVERVAPLSLIRI